MQKKKPSKSAKAAKRPAKKAIGISKEMTLGEIIQKVPAAAQIMAGYGLHCIGCHVSAFESLEQGARMHGLSEKQIDEMVEEIKKAAK